MFVKIIINKVFFPIHLLFVESSDRFMHNNDAVWRNRQTKLTQTEDIHFVSFFFFALDMSCLYVCVLELMW